MVELSGEAGLGAGLADLEGSDRAEPDLKRSKIVHATCRSDSIDRDRESGVACFDMHLVVDHEMEVKKDMARFAKVAKSCAFRNKGIERQTCYEIC
jgi:hypothetical protein